MFTVLSFFPCLCFGAILEPSFCSNLSGCHRLTCEALIIIFIVVKIIPVIHIKTILMVNHLFFPENVLCANVVKHVRILFLQRIRDDDWWWWCRERQMCFWFDFCSLVEGSLYISELHCIGWYKRWCAICPDTIGIWTNCTPPTFSLCTWNFSLT